MGTIERRLSKAEKRAAEVTPDAEIPWPPTDEQVGRAVRNWFEEVCNTTTFDRLDRRHFDANYAYYRRYFERPVPWGSGYRNFWARREEADLDAARRRLVGIILDILDAHPDEFGILTKYMREWLSWALEDSDRRHCLAGLIDQADEADRQRLQPTLHPGS